MDGGDVSCAVGHRLAGHRAIFVDHADSAAAGAGASHTRLDDRCVHAELVAAQRQAGPGRVGSVVVYLVGETSRDAGQVAPVDAGRAAGLKLSLSIVAVVVVVGGAGEGNGVLAVQQVSVQAGAGAVVG